ncbi:hypothetical protein [Staphylococcus americanisciuri]|uniref:Phage protein n=1 Tax=Staphylococcus americanisciuri TaxID=2973940 RepID=A0ABT2F3C1_9STAP|nr:hypothetical protein [Staphylococcus americanisciuri]MCS4486922.1 hypothetical protein [Staphylococcus americanisciuri]
MPKYDDFDLDLRTSDNSNSEEEAKRIKDIGWTYYDDEIPFVF